MKLVLIIKVKYDYPIIIDSFLTEESQLPIFNLDYQDFGNYKEYYLGDIKDKDDFGIELADIYLYEVDIKKEAREDIRDYIESIGVNIANREKED
jgi:hypothetical protein